MLITPRPTPSAHGIFRKSVNDLKGFRSHNRFIVLSEVKSDTIPDIIDMIFNLEPGGSSFLGSNTKRTKVTVINQSEVYGDVHGRADTRTRNVYIHYGFAECGIDNVNFDTVITFTDMDWNVIADKPFDSGKSIDSICTDVNVSYDQGTTGGEIYRDTKNYNRILIPSPEYYDEKDMLLIGDQEMDYNDMLIDNKSSNYFDCFDNYYNNLYRLTLRDLYDEGHTKIIKMNLDIENFSNRIDFSDNDIDNLVQEIAAQIKYSMEICGISGGEVDLGGSNDGFMYRNLRQYIRMEKDELYFHLRMFVNRLDELCDTYQDLPFVIMFNMRSDNVKVTIMDKKNVFGDLKSDNDVSSLSSHLKEDNAMGLYERPF